MVDYNAVKLYYKSLSNSMPMPQLFEMMEVMNTMILEAYLSREDEEDVKLMSIRGLLLLLANE